MGRKKVVGGAGIRAGRDVTIGDVTGQLAIGKFINQFKIGKITGKDLIELIDYLDNKRQESINQEILGSYAPSDIPYYPPRLREFVTGNRAEEMTQALAYLQYHRILLISGIGGVGKTTLASALVEMRPANVPLPFWLDFGKKMDATLGDVLEKLAGYVRTPEIARFKDEKRDAGQDDINRLTAELQKREPVWLVFDNFETILDGRKFHDPGMDLLFLSLRGSTHQAKIIITSRTVPISGNGESLIDAVDEEKRELKGLKIDSAIEYLIKNGLDGVEREKLKELAQGVDGHPLALKLLIEFVKEFDIQDTLKDLELFKEQKVSAIKIARKLFDKLAGNEKELLERISVFRQPESIGAIKKMFKENISLSAIKNLINKSLLETDHKGKYWLHPLVREFAYDDLENKREVHTLACEYYLSLPLPETPTKKEDVQSLIEAHYHACNAKEYDKAASIIFDNKLNIDLYLSGNDRTLIDLYNGLLPKDHFKDTRLLCNIKTHCSVLGNLGKSYLSLGDLRKAMQYYEEALKISQEIKDKMNECQWLGNLGTPYRTMGHVEKAIEYYEKALAIAREIGDRQAEGTWLGNLSIAYNILGKIEKNIECSENALSIAREIGDQSNESNELTNLSIAYRDLSQVEKAIEYSEESLVIARVIRDRKGESVNLLNLGNCYYSLKQLEKALDYYKKSLAIDMEIGYMNATSISLSNIGIVYSKLDQVEKAIEYFNKALTIEKKIGAKHNEGKSLFDIGNAYKQLGQAEEAINYYKKALAVAIEIRDKQRECTNSENIGIAYKQLGQAEEAINYYKKALAVAIEIRDKQRECTNSENIGIAYKDLGQIEKAIEYYEKALEIAREIGAKYDEERLLVNIGKAYAKLSQSEKAMGYYEKALEIMREIGYKDRKRKRFVIKILDFILFLWKLQKEINKKLLNVLKK